MGLFGETPRSKRSAMTDDVRFGKWQIINRLHSSAAQTRTMKQEATVHAVAPASKDSERVQPWLCFCSRMCRTKVCPRCGVEAVRV